MRQRILIAIALARQPELLIADEPTSALDVTVQRQILDHLQTLVDQHGTTLLFVTHSIEEALVVGNRVLVLSPRPGRVRAELDAQAFGLHSLGSPAFQAQAQRIHGLLFEEAA